MLFRWHGIVGSVGIIGAVAAPGMIAERWLSGGSAEATAPARSSPQHNWLRSEPTSIH